MRVRASSLLAFMFFAFIGLVTFVYVEISEDFGYDFPTRSVSYSSEVPEVSSEEEVFPEEELNTYEMEINTDSRYSDPYSFQNRYYDFIEKDTDSHSKNDSYGLIKEDIDSSLKNDSQYTFRAKSKREISEMLEKDDAVTSYQFVGDEDYSIDSDYDIFSRENRKEK